MTMQSCATCFKEESHYHIVVAEGVITTVRFVSANGYWDRELEKEEWFVENTDDPAKSGFAKKVKIRPVEQLPAGKKPTFSKAVSADWLQPKVYQNEEKQPKAEPTVTCKGCGGA